MSLLKRKNWRANHWGNRWGSWQCGQKQVAVGPRGALICDPNHLCDYFNDPEDVATKYIAAHAVLFWDDHGGSIYEGPLGLFIGGEIVLPGYRVIHECIGGDCGALILLPWETTVPKSITKLIPKLLKENDGENAAMLRPQPGIYSPFTINDDGTAPKRSDSKCGVSILARS